MTASTVTAPRLATLVLLTALSVLSLNMFLPSLPNMARDFGADYALVNLSVAGYLGITALLQLIVGPMSDRFGRRRVGLVALSIYIVASVGCALSTDIWLFLTFRVAQGIIVTGWVVSLAVIRDTSPPNEAASRIGYVTMAMAIAPMLGPTLGGVLDELFGWRANFWTFAGLGVIAWLICWFDLHETNTSPSMTFAKQFRDFPHLFRSRRFWGYALCIASSTGAFFSFVSGAPLVAQSILSVSPATLGIYIGIITAGFMVGSFLSGRFASRTELTTMMIIGRVAACCGPLAGLALFAAGFVNVFSLFGVVVLVGFGNGLTMPSANAGALSVRPQLAGSAAGLTGALTVGAGAVLTSITGAVISPQNAPYALHGIMLTATAIGLAAALYVLTIDRRERRTATADAA